MNFIANISLNEFSRGFHGGDYDYFRRGFSGNLEPWMLALGAFVLAALLFALALGSITYILRSIALYRLAVNRGMSSPWLAWLPVIGPFRIGSVADDISAREGAQSYFRYLLLIGLIISELLQTSFFVKIPGVARRFLNGEFPRLGNTTFELGLNQIASTVGFAVYVITLVALYKIYQHYRPHSATIWTVFSALLPFTQTIFLFMLRNDVPSVQNAQPGGYYHPNRPSGNPPRYPGNGGYYPPAAPQPPAYGYTPYGQPPQYPAHWQAPQYQPAEPPYQPPQANAAYAEAPAYPQPGAETAEPPKAPEIPTEPPADWGVNDNPQNGR